jgi:hypothetical protein
MAALEAPGNVAREIALYRRRLFAELGETSALAFPELLPLTIALPPSEAPTRPSRKALEHFLDPGWDGVAGDFRLAQPVLSRGLLYLRTEGPVEALAAAVRSLVGGRGFAIESPPLLDCALGFFLCRLGGLSETRLGLTPEAALAAALELAPPSLGFADAQLVFMRFDSGADPFSSLAWKELIVSRRLS